MISKKAIDSAEQIEKKHGTSYYIATLFFPKEIRDAVFILYAFVRIPDEFVDNPESGIDPKEKLVAWKKDWQDAYDTGTSNDPILEATAELFKKYSIPLNLSISFIDAMIQDTTVSRYKTYTDLQSYMHGSAEVVGLMLTHIMGYTKREAFSYAPKLGEAMQLTNFLRDIDEDYVQRNRIYIPQEDMLLHGVTEEMIRTQQTTREFISLMKYEIEKARKIFREADQGITLLNPNCQYAVQLSSRLYEKILDKIEEQNYNIFKKRARSNILEKTWIICKTYVTH